MVELKNLSSVDFKIMAGDRIAQLILLMTANAEFVACDKFDSTTRGTSGMGSTGR